MLSRRTLAFEANICRVLLSRCCLFTFTLAETICPRVASKRWTVLLAAMRRYAPSWAGVRVYELHPGRWDEFSHGLHVHLVSHVFFSDRQMVELCKRYGWGRFERTRIRRKEAAFYIGKYLDKKRPGAFKGLRLQSSFGPFPWTRLRDIVIEHIRSRSFRAAASRRWPDGRDWSDRSWPEKLALVSRVQFEAIAENLEWCPDRQDYLATGPRAPRSSRIPMEDVPLFGLFPSGSKPRFDPATSAFACCES